MKVKVVDLTSGYTKVWSVCCIHGISGIQEEANILLGFTDTCANVITVEDLRATKGCSEHRKG